MLKVHGEAIDFPHAEGSGAMSDSYVADRVVPIYDEVDGVSYDVLYVRVRTEFNETEETAMDRAEAIADRINRHPGYTPRRYNSHRAFRAGGAQ